MIDGSKTTRNVDPENWFYKRGELIGQLEASAKEITTETRGYRHQIIERILDTEQGQRPQCMRNFNAGMNSGRQMLCGFS